MAQQFYRGRLAMATLTLCTSVLANLATSGLAQATCGPNCNLVNTITVTTLPTLQITSNASQNASGSWDYVYTVLRTPSETRAPYVITAWTLPIGLDANVSNVSTQESYAYFTTKAAVTDGGLIITPGPAYALMPPILSADLALINKLTFTSPYAPTARNTAQIYLKGVEVQVPTGSPQTTIVKGITPSGPLSLSVALPGSPLTKSGVVPEPSSWSVMALGLLAVAFGTARQRRAEGARPLAS